MKLAELLQIPQICHFVFYLRFYYFLLFNNRFNSYRDLKGVDSKGMKHNFKALQTIKLSKRILKIIRPLSCIDRLDRNSKILVIGCRFECDILYLVGYGFKRENITAIDLYSYSPWIRLGNMHAMEFPDNSFDATIFGWVLTYSDMPDVAAREIIRVTKNNGILAAGLTVEPDDVIKSLARTNQLIGTTGMVKSAEDVLNFFSPHVGDLYFKHDRSDINRAGHSISIFSLVK